MIGNNILHYKILEKLGEGGMGVVYRAEDSKLKRPVTIKFLPNHISANSDESKRFENPVRAQKRHVELVSASHSNLRSEINSG